MPCSKPEENNSQARVSTFLSLPIEARNNVYKRVLAVPHPLFLFQDPGCPVEVFAPERPYRWLALLYTNRQISEEVKAVLYGMNQFTLEEMKTKNRRTGLLKSFLNSIGSVNAASLSHLCINFPATKQIEGHSEGIKLGEDSLQTLQLLRRQYTKLQTLKLLLFGENARQFEREDQENIGCVQNALVESNMQLRTIVSLNRIILRVCSGAAAPSLKEFVEELGWVVLSGNR